MVEPAHPEPRFFWGEPGPHPSSTIDPKGGPGRDVGDLEGGGLEAEEDGEGEEAVEEQEAPGTGPCRSSLPSGESTGGVRIQSLEAKTIPEYKSCSVDLSPSVVQRTPLFYHCETILFFSEFFLSRFQSHNKKRGTPGGGDAARAWEPTEWLKGIISRERRA